MRMKSSTDDTSDPAQRRLASLGGLPRTIRNLTRRCCSRRSPRRTRNPALVFIDANRDLRRRQAPFIAGAARLFLPVVVDSQDSLFSRSAPWSQSATDEYSRAVEHSTLPASRDADRNRNRRQQKLAYCTGCRPLTVRIEHGEVNTAPPAGLAWLTHS